MNKFTYFEQAERILPEFSEIPSHIKNHKHKHPAGDLANFYDGPVRDNSFILDTDLRYKDDPFKKILSLLGNNVTNKNELLALNILLANLQLCLIKDKNISVPKGKSNFAPSGFYKGILKYKTFINAFVFLEKNGLIYVTPGIYLQNIKRQTRIFPAPELVNILYDFDFAHIYSVPKVDLVIVKDYNKKIIEHNYDFSETEEMMKSYNNFLTGLTIEISGNTYNGSVFQIQRVFNNDSTEQNGRYYSLLTYDFRSEERKTIKIDGEKTVERDYGNFMIRLLHHVNNIEITDGDIYMELGNKVCAEIGYYNEPDIRNLVKTAINISLNTKNRETACRALLRDLVKTYYPEEKNVKNPEDYYFPIAGHDFTAGDIIGIFSDVLEELSYLEEYLFKEHGLDLMNIESEITSQILKDLTKKGIPVLQVHDSYIVKEKDILALEYAMMKFYKEYANGHSPVIK